MKYATPLLLIGSIALLILHPGVIQTRTDGFAVPSFMHLWTRTDAPVANGQADRSWLWGAAPGPRRYERFAEADGGVRLVQYFDKGRMELTDLPAGSDPWAITSGLLVVELISGQIQTGYQDFVTHTPATIPIVGDPVANPDTPTYAQLAPITSLTGNNRAPDRRGQRVSATYGPDGIGDAPDMALPETEIVAYEPVTGHNIPRIFADFLQQQGVVSVDGRTQREQIIDPLFTLGYPISEPYWVRARVGGQPMPVLFQAFERRLISYTPDHPPAWQVELGNVGQHYMNWRYGQPLRYAQPPLPGGVRVTETTMTIPTYDYASALVPTTPDDPIYPYPRLDFTQVGSPQPHTYRAVIVENRFLTLTFLPELGGRLYQAIPRATGQNMLYQNPVIKPSPFGQRGWWLGVGGLEWAMPTEEHGYLEYLPWDLTWKQTAQGVTVQVTTTEQQTGMRVEAFIDLPANRGNFMTRMNVINPTDAAHPLQMWTNAALSPGATSNIGPGLRFIAPTEHMIVHATQDRDLPGPGEWIDWPEHHGRDLSYPRHWSGYLGVFSPDPVPFLGIYDADVDAGAVVVHHDNLPGAKLFGFSTNFDTALYTDNGSAYVELWSGAQTTFWDYPPLPAGASRVIHTDWYPLWGLGDLAQATANAAIGVTQHATGATVSLVTTQIIPDATVVIEVDGQEVVRTIPLELRPDQPLALDVPIVLPPQSQLRLTAPGIDITAVQFGKIERRR